MRSYKTQFQRICNTFIAVTVVIMSLTLVASGLAVTKINTEYMDTGVRTEKIVVEKENEEIFFSVAGRRFEPPEALGERFGGLMYYLPAPLNGIYCLTREIVDFVKEREFPH